MRASRAVRSRGQPRLGSNTPSWAGDTEDSQAAESGCKARTGTVVLQQGCVLCAKLCCKGRGRRARLGQQLPSFVGSRAAAQHLVFDPRKPSSFQDAPATCWERGRTCPATMRRGSAPACPTWWAPTATSARPSTGTWRAAGAAGPATATPAAPSAPTATRYHCHCAPSTLGWSPAVSALIFLWKKKQQYLLLISLPGFTHAPVSSLSVFISNSASTALRDCGEWGRGCHCQQELCPRWATPQPRIAQSIESTCPVAPSAPSHLWEPPQRGSVFPKTFCSCFLLPIS